MSRDRDKHLSPEELAWLAAEAESASASGTPGLDRESAYSHAVDCTVCGPRLRAAQRSVQVSHWSLVSTVASERTSACPAEDKWLRLAAGLMRADESAVLLEHAANCDYCGQLLREATEDLDPELSAEETESIRQLPSALPGWQRDVARKMAEVSGAGPSGGVTKEQEYRPRSAWSFSAWMRWAVPLAVAAVLAAAILWIGLPPSLSSTNRLLAQAYTAQRPVDLRFPGANYGPLRQERGEIGPNHSPMDEPPELLEAKSQIARGLASHPQEAAWLQAKARADLFEGRYQSAIEALQQAEGTRPGDAVVKVDLATAYYERAGTKPDPAEQAADYELALQSLNSVLSRNPKDLVALFNRAVVYQKLKKYPEAVEDWQHYLQLDPSGEWAEAAKRLLGDVQREKVVE